MSKIPKKLHLTCKNKTTLDNNYIWKNCYQKYKEIYDDYEIILYDDEDIYDLINKHYPEYLDKIKQIKIGAIIADIFRYLILYLEGGIYSDLDCEPLKKIDPLLMKGHTYYHASDDNLFYIYPKERQLIDNRHDFYSNPCNNCKCIKEDDILTFKCFGHKIEESFSTFLCYEVHKDWHENSGTDVFSSDLLYKKEFGITQWFMISEPKQDLFLKAFMKCIENLDGLITLEKGLAGYPYKIGRWCGPHFFTKIVVDDFNGSDKIKILPCDFFCSGSVGLRSNGSYFVPITNNSYVKHLFTASWLPEARGFTK
jgi:hypothetical protein